MIDISPSTTRARQRLRHGRDKLATGLITACGIGVIGAVLAIGVFLAIEVVPLFAPARVASLPQAESVDTLRPWHEASELAEHAGLVSSGETVPAAWDGERLWLADGGEIALFTLDAGTPRLVARVQATETGRQITAMAALTGGRALIVGDDAGGVRRWVSAADDPLVLASTYDTPSAVPIRELIALPERRFLAWDATGGLALYQAQSGLLWSGRAPDGEPLGFDAQGKLLWSGEHGPEQLLIDAEHAEITWRTLWTPRHYEGHAEPQHRWQSGVSGLADEPRFGLAPLAWGTLKAAGYALLFAIPLALGAAMHSAFFMSRRLRQRIKPTLELMEALPGVVIGFIAGLVLAPYVERHLAGAFALLLILPLGILAGGWLWSRWPSGVRRRLPLGWAGIWLVPWLALLIALSLWLSPGLERVLFGGDLRVWLEATFGLDYASRNAMIVGLAMGFAVIPTIYALAEDALSGVPTSLGEGAQALGATRWQTLWKVLLPAASPGIFSAVMIGAGRAVGETMIVLMATGNTAIMTLSPLEGMRTLSANIIIELPEAVVGGTHYRLLFLTALVLFVFTFCVNTLAEVVRSRLKRRYRRLGGAG